MERLWVRDESERRNARGNLRLAEEMACARRGALLPREEDGDDVDVDIGDLDSKSDS